MAVIIVATMSFLLRRCIALAAAYAVVLQATFAMAAFAPHPAGEQFVICRADRGSTPAAPASHNDCNACLAGHCSGGVAAPEPGTIAVPAPPMVGSAPHAFFIAAFTVLAPRTDAHSPRAPPGA